MNGSSLVFLHSLQFTLPSNLNSSELFSWDGHWMTFSFRFWRGRSVGRKPVGPLRPTRGASVAVASQWSRAKAGPDQNMMSSKWIQIAGDLYKTHMGEWKTSLNRTLAHVFFFLIFVLSYFCLPCHYINLFCRLDRLLREPQLEDFLGLGRGGEEIEEWCWKPSTASNAKPLWSETRF